MEWVQIITPVITAITAIIAVVLSVKNLSLIRESNSDKQDEMLFDIIIINLEKAIKTFELLDSNHVNNSYSWAIFAEQLSSFHNLNNDIKNKNLRRCYCIKLYSYTLRVKNILEKVDDYRFFYGVKDYKNRNHEDLLAESYGKHLDISPNALGCIIQFITLFHGIKGNYMFLDEEIDKILTKKIFNGFRDDNDFSEDDINQMQQPLKNMYRYINEWQTCQKNLNFNK